MWDDILSTGMVLYGIAVDDAHFFKTPGDRTKSTSWAWMGDGSRGESQPK